MSKRVLIIGGYGNFGSYIAKRLSRENQIQLIIAGRSFEKAQDFCASLEAINSPIPFKMDISQDLIAFFETIMPNIVIHTSGPFQGQVAFVAEACIDYGCHYMDLADGRSFVNNITKLNKTAKDKNLLVISGASSVPCLSSCIIDSYISQFQSLETVEYAISTAQKTNRGLATTEAVLSYAGSPFETLIEGEKQNVYGWQNLHRHKFLELGYRFLGNCDVPDLDLFPSRYTSLKTQRFYAGLEIPFMHIGLWGLSWLKRIGLLPPLNKIAPFLLKMSFLFDRLGSDKSAFYMKMQGTNEKNNFKKITFDLTACSGDGPYIPCMPAIILAIKISKEEIENVGAMPCVGLITLDEYLSELKPLDISWSVSE